MSRCIRTKNTPERAKSKYPPPERETEGLSGFGLTKARAFKQHISAAHFAVAAVLLIKAFPLRAASVAEALLHYNVMPEVRAVAHACAFQFSHADFSLLINLI